MCWGQKKSSETWERTLSTWLILWHLVNRSPTRKWNGTEKIDLHMHQQGQHTLLPCSYLRARHFCLRLWSGQVRPVWAVVLAGVGLGCAVDLPSSETGTCNVQSSNLCIFPMQLVTMHCIFPTSKFLITCFWAGRFLALAYSLHHFCT